MWYFLSVAVFKGKLLAVKVNSNFKQKKWVRGGVTKKSHGHNFDFSGLARNQRLTNRVGSTLIPWRAWKIKIVAVSFFCYASYFWWRTRNFKVCWLWAAITPIKKLARTKSTTISESSESELSHGPIPEKFALTKMSRRRDFSKKRRFLWFFVTRPKNLNGCQSDNFDPRRSTHGSS